MEKLTEFLAGQPTPIEHIAPPSPNYAEIRSGYLNDPSLDPPLIVRPQSTEEVALITSFLVENGIGFTVRAGGHDLFGRSFKPDAVALDLRKLNRVQVDRQSLTARIGGGALTSDLAQALGEHGLVAASPTVPSVGYLGWAMHGGYGPYLGHFGLGADQILAAKVINHQGKVVEADAELLKGIRGAGAAFGIVIEATIRVFPLEKVSSVTSLSFKRPLIVLYRCLLVSSCSPREISVPFSGSSTIGTAKSLQNCQLHWGYSKAS